MTTLGCTTNARFRQYGREAAERGIVSSAALIIASSIQRVSIDLAILWENAYEQRLAELSDARKSLRRGGLQTD